MSNIRSNRMNDLIDKMVNDLESTRIEWTNYHITETESMELGNIVKFLRVMRGYNQLNPITNNKESL